MGLQDMPKTNQQGILFGRRMSFALEHTLWERQGNPAVLRVLEALSSRDQELLAVLMLFQRVTVPQILRVVKRSYTN